MKRELGQGGEHGALLESEGDKAEVDLLPRLTHPIASGQHLQPSGFSWGVRGMKGGESGRWEGNG